MRQRLCPWLLTFYAVILASAAEDHCLCHIRTPCSGSDGGTIPNPPAFKWCPPETTDCRQPEHQRLCKIGATPRDKFSCWTACSSLAIKRDCGEPPAGFVFEKSGETSATECQDPMNIRDKCILHEYHILHDQKGRAKSKQCPEMGSDLASLFDGLDDLPIDRSVSAGEVLKALPWLHQNSREFLATNFSDIDADGNYKLSWYELEVFCGHAVNRLPRTDFMALNPSDMWNILHTPLLVVPLLSTFIPGQLFGIVQVMIKHALGYDTSDGEHLVVKAAYIFFAYLWPVVFCVFIVYYYFGKIQFEVCDAPMGATTILSVHLDAVLSIRTQFLLWTALQVVASLAQLNHWRFRHFPTSPSKDIERMIYINQVKQVQLGRVFQALLVGVVVATPLLMLYNLVHRGHTLPIALEGLEQCMREEPDIALLFDVNERFFAWRLVQIAILSVYTLCPCGINDKGYSEVPTDYKDLSFADRQEALKDHLEEEMEEWEYYA